MSVPFMLLVRSMTRTTSTGLDGAVPHGPLHADETTSPVEPWLTPTTRPKLNGVLAAPAIRTALHMSPTAGLQDENRVGPEPAKSDATGGLWPSEKCGSHTSGTSREMYGFAGVEVSTPIRHL